MKTAVAIVLAVIAQAIGNTLLSKGMKEIASMPAFADGFSPMMLVCALQNPLIWTGIVLLIVFFACFLSTLSWSDLSFVLPATATGYVLNVFLASKYLDEPVSQYRWMGSILIVAGVALVSWSSGKPPACEVVEREPSSAQPEGR